jgi:hypothetical protein
MALTTTTIRGDIAQAVFEGRSNRQNLFIGAEVMPIYVADVRSGEYLKINLGQSEALNDDATKIAAGSAYPRVSRKFVSDTFATTEFGLEEILPDATQRDLARFLDVEVAVADMLLNQIQIGHEARVAALTYAANGLTAISGAGAGAAYTEANITSFDLPADVAAGKLELAKFGVLPNTLVMSATLFERVRRSTKVQNQMFGVVATELHPPPLRARSRSSGRRRESSRWPRSAQHRQEGPSLLGRLCLGRHPPCSRRHSRRRVRRWRIRSHDPLGR